MSLAVVYTGLAYLGATYTAGGGEMERVELLASITHRLFGPKGHIILALAISLACLTTAIGLTSSCAEFFNELSNNKISYNALAIGIAVFSGVFSVLGVDTIVSFAAPILGILYPCVIVLLVMVLFDEHVVSDWMYYLGVFGPFIISFSEVIGGILKVGLLQKLPTYLPFSNLGLHGYSLQ